eukprot:TRINITY_DN20365_c0_g1_i4.p1 TRINITY_DN20365_c0_g1~~TRINITY_DN20365_c0_g1_i4.p1  ORF type:complete len:375 (+),score=57.56 TRINITY_DN20365_c0_g1_i4:175-1299(+)
MCIRDRKRRTTCQPANVGVMSSSWSSSPRSQPGQGCEVCGKATELSCSRCLAVFYCGKEHQRVHYQTHQHACAVAGSPGLWLDQEFTQLSPSSHVISTAVLRQKLNESIDDTMRRIKNMNRFPRKRAVSRAPSRVTSARSGVTQAQTTCSAPRSRKGKGTQVSGSKKSAADREAEWNACVKLDRSTAASRARVGRGTRWYDDPAATARGQGYAPTASTGSATNSQPLQAESTPSASPPPAPEASAVKAVRASTNLETTTSRASQRSYLAASRLASSRSASRSSQPVKLATAARASSRRSRVADWEMRNQEREEREKREAVVAHAANKKAVEEEEMQKQRKKEHRDLTTRVVSQYMLAAKMRLATLNAMQPLEGL